MSETWHTSIGDLMRLFRDALVALAPVGSNARIWSLGNKYDEWEAIEATLFGSIVAAALPESFGWPAEVKLPEYDRGVPSEVPNSSFIEVILTGNQDHTRFSLKSLESVRTPMDHVAYFDLAAPQKRHDLAPWDTCDFRLRAKTADRTVEFSQLVVLV